ncbi:restriction endonuclease-like motif protein [Ranid herpesvirus 3]|uniref:Restriction endonuclease-like motif protein n=1 Tax=Ranid herpesvirus 3 TaxID=1987509 RepID=A0A1X9T5H1_9VIRU|nr:restriction endonuclease-like motif protein [Ranid herpesvirus 3]ARR28895.1 restriction endonuclease-like motif protein [Ranid herpesvirus 3]
MYKTLFYDNPLQFRLFEREQFSELKQFYSEALCDFRWVNGPSNQAVLLDEEEVIVKVLEDPFYPNYSSTEQLLEDPKGALAILKIIWSCKEYGATVTAPSSFLENCFERWRIACMIIRKGKLASEGEPDLLVQKWVGAYKRLKRMDPLPDAQFRNFCMELKGVRDTIKLQLLQSHKEQKTKLLFESLTFPYVHASAIHLVPYFYIKVFGRTLGLRIIQMELRWMNETTVTATNGQFTVSYPSVAQSVRPDRLIVSGMINAISQGQNPSNRFCSTLFGKRDWSQNCYRETVLANLFARPPICIDKLFKGEKGEIMLVNDEGRRYVPRIVTAPSYQLALGLSLLEHQIPTKFIGELLHAFPETPELFNVYYKIIKDVSAVTNRDRAMHLITLLRKAELGRVARLTTTGHLVVNRNNARNYFPKGGFRSTVVRERFKNLYLNVHPLIAMFESNIFVTLQRDQIIVRSDQDYEMPVSTLEQPIVPLTTTDAAILDPRLEKGIIVDIRLKPDGPQRWRQSLAPDRVTVDGFRADERSFLDESEDESLDFGVQYEAPAWHSDLPSDAEDPMNPDDDNNSDIVLSSSEGDDSDRDDEFSETSEEPSEILEEQIVFDDFTYEDEPIFFDVPHNSQREPLTSTPAKTPSTASIVNHGVSLNTSTSTTSSSNVSSIPEEESCLYDRETVSAYNKHARKTVRETFPVCTVNQPAGSLDTRVKGHIRKYFAETYMKYFNGTYRGLPDPHLSICSSTTERFVRTLIRLTSSEWYHTTLAPSKYVPAFESSLNVISLTCLNVLRITNPYVFSNYFTIPTHP